MKYEWANRWVLSFNCKIDATAWRYDVHKSKTKEQRSTVVREAGTYPS